MNKNLKGVFTALVSPFIEGEIDYSSFEKLIKFQLENKINGFVINGTTAESPTLKKEEKVGLFKIARQISGAKIPLIMGTGSNCTVNTIAESQEAERLGADAVLVVVPYYNKPPQRGLKAHFKAVAESIGIPLILYNVPSRTVTGLNVETIQELSLIKNIVGIKEATGNIDFAKQIIQTCGTDFLMLTGDDSTYLEFLKAGGHGVISVASHIFPAKFCQWLAQIQTNQDELANFDFKKHLKMIDYLFIESNPIPVKKALELMNLISCSSLRLPLMELESDKTDILKIEMKALGLI